MARNVSLCYLAEVGNNAKPLFNSLNGFVSQKQSNKEKKLNLVFLVKLYQYVKEPVGLVY